MAIESIIIGDLITRQNIAMNLTLQICGLVFCGKFMNFRQLVVQVLLSYLKQVVLFAVLRLSKTFLSS